jgi:hypothetical protein
LGGIANLGMSRGFLIETEAQLVIISVFMFCVLELGRTHLVSYFWFFSVHYPGEDQQQHHRMMRLMLVFVDVVVCLLQFFVVVIWQMTMLSLLTSGDDIFRVILLLVVSLFLCLRTLSVFQGLLELVGCFVTKSDGTMEKGNMWMGNTLWKCEGYLYIVSVWVIIAALSFIPMVNESNNPEGTLLFLEKIMYTATASVDKFGIALDPAKLCDNSISTNSLVSMAMAKGKFDCTKTKLYENWEIGPVHMKVFAWTRFFQLQEEYSINTKNACTERDCAPPSVLFCSNGFEQHWGQCKKEFLLFPARQLAGSWKTLVTNSTK